MCNVKTKKRHLAQCRGVKGFLEMMIADLSVKGCLRVIQSHITRASCWGATAREGSHGHNVCHVKQHLLYSIAIGTH